MLGLEEGGEEGDAVLRGKELCELWSYLREDLLAGLDSVIPLCDELHDDEEGV